MMVWSLTFSWAYWSVTSSEPLGSITTNKFSGGDRIPVKLFKILKDDAVRVLLHSICQQIWKTQRWPQGWESVILHSKAKECSNYHAI